MNYENGTRSQYIITSMNSEYFVVALSKSSKIILSDRIGWNRKAFIYKDYRTPQIHVSFQCISEDEGNNTSQEFLSARPQYLSSLLIFKTTLLLLFNNLNKILTVNGPSHKVSCHASLPDSINEKWTVTSRIRDCQFLRRKFQI